MRRRFRSRVVVGYCAVGDGRGEGLGCGLLLEGVVLDSIIKPYWQWLVVPLVERRWGLVQIMQLALVRRVRVGPVLWCER